MKRQRPGLPPIHVRVQVAERQLAEAGRATILFETDSKDQQLSALLKFMFGDQPVHLDHNPALRTRAYNPRVKNIAARYKPHAHDPDYLIYRDKHDHHIKTNIRGDGAQFPDRVLINRERRRGKPKRAKAKIPNRRNPWPQKGTRPFRSSK